MQDLGVEEGQEQKPTGEAEGEDLIDVVLDSTVALSQDPREQDLHSQAPTEQLAHEYKQLMEEYD